MMVITSLKNSIYATIHTSKVELLFPSNLVDQSNSIVLTLAFLKALDLLVVCQFLTWNLSILLKVIAQGHQKVAQHIQYFGNSSPSIWLKALVI